MVKSRRLYRTSLERPLCSLSTSQNAANGSSWVDWFCQDGQCFPPHPTLVSLPCPAIGEWTDAPLTPPPPPVSPFAILAFDYLLGLPERLHDMIASEVLDAGQRHRAAGMWCTGYSVEGALLALLELR